MMYELQYVVQTATCSHRLKAKMNLPWCSRAAGHTPSHSTKQSLTSVNTWPRAEVETKLKLLPINWSPDSGRSRAFKFNLRMPAFGQALDGVPFLQRVDCCLSLCHQPDTSSIRRMTQKALSWLATLPDSTRSVLTSRGVHGGIHEFE